MQYPIGQFQFPQPAEAAAKRTEYLTALGSFPAEFAAVALQLKRKTLLDETYREGGWTARQVIHHVADSHVNAYVRHKRVLTEDHPTLTPYDEKRWAELTDVRAVPIEASLEILRHLHVRLTTLLATCTEAQWQRTAFHGGAQKTYRLDQLSSQYAWHGRHHLGHLGVVLGQ